MLVRVEDADTSDEDLLERGVGDLEAQHVTAVRLCRTEDGLRIGASGLYSEVWPGDWRRLFADNTKTEAFEVRASIAPLQSQKQSLTLTLTAGFSNVSERDYIGPIYYDAIRTISLNGDYRLQDNFGGANYLTVNWRQGLDILGASDKSDPWVSVWGASPKFSALNFWYTRYQTINDAFSVKLASAGQIASGPMYLSQQFYLGGIAFGRGYGAAEISGDNGVAGSLELRFAPGSGVRDVRGRPLRPVLREGRLRDRRAVRVDHADGGDDRGAEGRHRRECEHDPPSEHGTHSGAARRAASPSIT